MKKIITAIAVLLLVIGIPISGQARVPHGYGHGHYARTHYSHTRRNTRRAYYGKKAYMVPRDRRGRIKRSSEAKEEFMRASGYQHGRKGYVVDHVVPLKRGGKDTPDNMQWQTEEDARAKDRWE